MNKKLFIVLTIAFAVVGKAWCDNNFPDGYMTDSIRALHDFEFIHDYPELTSGAFADDFYYYQWGRDMREQGMVSQEAISDERADVYTVYSEVCGIALSPQTTPQIILLCERAATDATYANARVKNKYQRKRPFATFHEASLTPWTDDEEASTFSYPSGHSSRGYMFALVLCTVMPEHTTAIMDRAQRYARNRVICGHHWESDIEASLLLAATVFANIVCLPEFQAQLALARAEYNQRLAADAEQVQANNAPSAKDIRDGQVLITRDGETYNAQGVKLLNR